MKLPASFGSGMPTSDQPWRPSTWLERHGITVSHETLRRIMMAAGLWTAKAAKRATLHQTRYRRDRRGELVQVDGSDHDWFEVSLIPTTLQLTTLGTAPVGATVNLEVDVIAKYVERLLGARS